MTLSQQDLEWASSLRSPYTQSHTWRTEPEIDNERQAYLTRQLALLPDPQRGVYPFKDISLSRADIEWLLTTHQQQGPVEWTDPQRRTRLGLDLRGADLRQDGLRIGADRSGQHHVALRGDQGARACVVVAFRATDHINAPSPT